MDTLYIKVVDGVVTDHPMFSDSVKALYPDFDGMNLPEGIKDFVRVQPPVTTMFQTATHSYQLIGNKVTDAWTVSDKSETEKQDIIASFGNLPEWVSIDPVTGEFIVSDNPNRKAAIIGTAVIRPIVNAPEAPKNV